MTSLIISRNSGYNGDNEVMSQMIGRRNCFSGDTDKIRQTIRRNNSFRGNINKSVRNSPANEHNAKNSSNCRRSDFS